MATWQQRLLREKLEITSGTVVATTPADALLALDVTERLLEADYAQQSFVRGIEGAQGEDLSNVNAGADYSIEAAPPATAGAPPVYAHLLQSSGMAMEIDAGDVVFTPINPSLDIPSCTMMMKNGALQQILTGVRGSFSFTAERGSKPRFTFTRRGRYQAPVAYVAEAHTFTDWARAIDCTPENMFAFTLGGTTLPVRSFTFSDGRQVTVDKYMNLAGAQLGPRSFTGSMTVRWPELASKDLLTQIRNGVTEPLVWTLGKTAGKVLTVSAPKVQIKWSGEQNIDGDMGITLDLVFQPDAGDDEIEIRFS